MTKSLNVKKRRAQRGRPRREGVDREPNGKPSRAKVDESAMNVALRARTRCLGVPEAMAHDQKAESPIGRLNLRGLITEAHLWAAKRYSTIHAQRLKDIQAKVGLAVLGERYFTLEDSRDPAQIDDEIGKTAAKHREMRKCITDRERAVFELVVLDRREPPTNFYPELFGALVKLAHHFDYDPIKNLAMYREEVVKRVHHMLKRANEKAA